MQEYQSCKCSLNNEISAHCQASLCFQISAAPSETGKPSSASSIAGAKTSESDFLPQHLVAASQAAAVPGTVTQSALRGDSSAPARNGATSFLMSSYHSIYSIYIFHIYPYTYTVYSIQYTSFLCIMAYTSKTCCRMQGMDKRGAPRTSGDELAPLSKVNPAGERPQPWRQCTWH